MEQNLGCHVGRLQSHVGVGLEQHLGVDRHGAADRIEQSRCPRLTQADDDHSHDVSPQTRS
jgi:hypothetical protein